MQTLINFILGYIWGSCFALTITSIIIRKSIKKNSALILIFLIYTMFVIGYVYSQLQTYINI